MRPHLQDNSLFVFPQGFVTGGKDGVVVIWDVLFEQCLKAFKVERSAMNYGSILLDDCPSVRSIHTNSTRILVGTGNDEVIEIEEDGKMTIIAQVREQRHNGKKKERIETWFFCIYWEQVES